MSGFDIVACPSCRTRFDSGSLCDVHDKSGVVVSGSEGRVLTLVAALKCPGCGIAVIVKWEGETNARYRDAVSPASFPNPTWAEVIWPSVAVPPPPEEIPAKYASDYYEALTVLKHSPKSAAALGRRVLEAVLEEEYQLSGSLASMIDEFLGSSSHAIPSALADNIDVIRNTGNFASHVQRCDTTQELLDVTAEEAEFTLELVGDLLDHVFVRPRRLRAKRDAYEQKIVRANKNLKKPQGGMDAEE